MIKQLLPLLVLTLLLTGCSEAPKEQVEDNKQVYTNQAFSIENTNPFSIILKNHGFSFDQTKSTEIKIINEDPSSLTVTIKEDGYIDDSIKGATYVLELEKQDDNSWNLLSNTQTEVECYREKNAEGLCL